MKKLLSVLLSIALISAFCCACQGGGVGSSDSLPNSEQSGSLQPSDTSDSESQDSLPDETSDKPLDSESDWSEWA